MNNERLFATEWIDAISDARKTLKFDGIAELLRDKSLPLDMGDRLLLAELLLPTHASSKCEAVLKKRSVGRSDRDDRNLEFYLAIESFKIKQGLTNLSDAERLKIWKDMGFDNASHETCRTAEKRGRRLWEDAQDVDRD